MGGNATKCYDGRGKPDGDTGNGAAGTENAGANGSAGGAGGAGGKGTNSSGADGTTANAGGDDSKQPTSRGQHEVAMLAIITKLFEEMDIDCDRRIGMADWIILDPLMSGGTVPMNGAPPAPDALNTSRKKFRQYALMHGVTLPPSSGNASSDDASLFIAREDYIKYYRARMDGMLDAEFPTEITALRKQFEHTKQKIAGYKTAAEAERLRAPSAMSDAKSDRKSDAAPPPLGGEGGGLFARSQTIVLDNGPDPTANGSDRKSVGGGGGGGSKAPAGGDVSSPARSPTMAITVTTPNASVTPIVTAAPTPVSPTAAAADQKRAN